MAKTSVVRLVSLSRPSSVLTVHTCSWKLERRGWPTWHCISHQPSQLSPLRESEFRTVSSFVRHKPAGCVGSRASLGLNHHECTTESQGWYGHLTPAGCKHPLVSITIDAKVSKLDIVLETRRNPSPATRHNKLNCV